MKGKRTTEAEKKKPPPTTVKQAPRFTLDTLIHIKGALNKRLETSLNRLPVPSMGDINYSKKGNSIMCQLHRWAQREKYVLRNNKGGTPIAPIPEGARRHVMYCNACEVFFCFGCYKMYHTWVRCDDEGRTDVNECTS